MDECLDHSYLAAGSIVTRGTVSKGNSTVSVVDPGRVGCRGRGEGVGGNADYPEEGVLVAGAHRPEELLDVYKRRRMGSYWSGLGCLGGWVRLRELVE